ncbi:MAG TPA: hypothetical protein VMW72_27060 [Sedimentisphaerales bacterium]|nr:hypothetical protein [Sedimentisphaerales bacterium]
MNDQEIILNLWYVFDDMGLIYSLRARAYVRAGSDEEKLRFLQQYATLDFLIARPFPVPARLSTEFLEENGSQKLPVFTMKMLETQGGPLSVGDLFKEVYDELENSLPMQTELTIPEKPLVCITPLFADDAGRIYPKIDRQMTLKG